jgi:hypothetical protein
LNVAFLTGAAMIAGLVGAIADSWGAFWIAFVILIACSLYSGDIRQSGRRFGDRD